MDELGTCLRTWRDRLDPADAGLSGSARRRAPGLRREEVAQLAGLSVDYLARLEQGRTCSASPARPHPPRARSTAGSRRACSACWTASPTSRSS
jgi:hypothetical protein